MRFASLPAVFSLTTLFLALGGCRPPPPATTAVTGIVTLDAQPLTGANVIFIPQGETTGNGGTGQTNAEGNFTAHLHSGQSLQGPPGLLPGSYKVVITKPVNPDGTPFVATADIAPIDASWKELVPEPFCNDERTTLKAEVGVTSVELIYDLKSKQ